MIHLLLGLVHGFADLARAVYDLILRRDRGRYSATGIIRAPVEAVWDLVVRRDVTYAASNMHMVLEPLEGHDGVFLAKFRQGQKEFPAIAMRFERIEAPVCLGARYLKDLSPGASGVGTDDQVTVTLAADGADRTRVTFARELTHDSFSTRISAPIGVRSAVAMTVGQAELEAGHAPKRSPLWHQLVWTALAFLSFAWLLDWRIALAIMGIIAVHECGHALFMWRYGLGISFVSFIPFLGGVAAPKRYYDSEWQKGIVSLMGVGVSLPVSLALIAIAEATNSPNLSTIAILAIIINAVNLIPFPALDGSVVVSMLLGKLHKSLNLAFMILMFGIFVAVGIVMRSPLVWAAIALSFISIVQVTSLKIDDHLIKMGRAQSIAMLGLYAALVAGHVFAFQWSTIATARAESALISACIKDAGSAAASATAVKACKEQHRLWLLPDK